MDLAGCPCSVQFDLAGRPRILQSAVIGAASYAGKYIKCAKHQEHGFYNDSRRGAAEQKHADQRKGNQHNAHTEVHHGHIYAAVSGIRYTPGANAIERRRDHGQNENDVQDIVDDGYHGMEGSFIFGNILVMRLKGCVHALLRDQKMTF